MIRRNLIALLLCAATASAQHSVGPWLVHSIPGGPSVTKPLPASFNAAARAWSEYAYIDSADSTQTAMIGGVGEAGSPAFRGLGLDHGLPTLSMGDLHFRARSALDAGWHLLAATYDGSALHFVVDGTEVAAANGKSSSAAAQIEFSPNESRDLNSSFNGRIAFYVADYVLTQAELLELVSHRPELDVMLFEENSKPWPFPIKQRLGEPFPQPPDEMPHGAPAQRPVAKPLPPSAPTLRPMGANSWEIAANWKLWVNEKASRLDGKELSSGQYDDGSWLAATVPGTVLTTLIDRGVYPDPDFGLNNLTIPESLNKHDDWYRVKFNEPAHRTGQHIFLHFGGVSYAAEFYLNGVRLGDISGAFQRASFDITRVLCVDNTLAVRILPPPHPGIPQEQSIKGGPGFNGGAMVLDGPGFMSTEGWDWLPAMRDRDMGIWQAVTLTANGSVTLGDPQIITHLPLPDTSRAEVEMRLPVVNSLVHTVSVRAVVEFEGKRIMITQSVAPGASIINLPHTTLEHPRLWWPNGYGNPELYHANITLSDSTTGAVTDQRSLTFGVREVSVELSLFDHEGKLDRVEVLPTVARSLGLNAVDVRHEAMRDAKTLWAASLNPDAENTAAVRAVTDEPGLTDLVIKVNGVRIAARGGNWGLDDSRKRVSRERLEPYFKLHREANLNIIRNWQGQNTEEVFYQLADEYGLMVWNDFWMVTQNSNAEPTDPQLLLANARDVVRRYRNHPSIVLWCGRNEGVPPPAINEGLITLLQQEDGTRYYSPSSNRVNLRPSGPYQWKNPGDYYSTLDRGFSVELGTSSFPTLEAFEAMTEPADRWPISDVWAYHDWHQARGGDTHILMQKIAAQLGAPDSLESFEKRAQMFNFVDHQAIFEGFYQHLWAPNSGRMLWMTHSSWPSTYWQIYSSDYDTQASYFATMRANAPLHPQMDLSDGTLAVVNTTLAARPNLQLRLRVVDLAGHSIEERTISVDAAANATTASWKVPIEQLFGKSSLLLVRLDLADNSGHTIADNFYWIARDDASYRPLASMPQAKLDVKPERHAGRVDLLVRNIGASPALEIKFNLQQPDGRRILPAYWSDNYISLLPGEERTIHVSFEGEANPKLTMRGWNLATQSVAP